MLKLKQQSQKVIHPTFRTIACREMFQQSSSRAQIQVSVLEVFTRAEPRVIKADIALLEPAEPSDLHCLNVCLTGFITFPTFVFIHVGSFDFLMLFGISNLLQLNS